MWIIIQTDTYKEQDVVSDLMKVQGFKDYFLPLYRKERINGSRKDVVFLPLITRMLFLNIDIPDFREGERADAEFDGYLRGIFNDSGYILKVEEGKDGGRVLTKENVKARLMCVANDKEKSLCQRFRAATIPDRDVESLRLFVDQMNSAMTEYSVVDEKYTLLESTQDTVMFTEGPYQGFQGVVKQKNVNGRRSHYFYLRIANWTFCIPNARRGRYVVFKEATHGKKFREVTAWTNADLLIGRFQSLSNMVGITGNDALTLADDSASLLRLLLLKLGKKRKIEELVAETASDKHLSSKPLDQLLMLFLCGSKNPKETIDKGKDAVPTLSAEEASALISLNRHYLSTPNTIDYVLSSHIPDVTLRPFLTPNIEQENNVIHHGDFTEHIIKCNLTPYLWQSQSIDDSDILSPKSIGGGQNRTPHRGARWLHRRLLLQRPHRR